MTESTALTQIALAGVRNSLLTLRKGFDTHGTPPSRENANSMREQEVRPASAHRKLETTIPMMRMFLRIDGISDFSIIHGNASQPWAAPSSTVGNASTNAQTMM